jgi:hypothetical protein
MLRNHRSLQREWCAKMGIPERDGLGRHRYARGDGLLTEGPHGDRALPATSQDAAVLLLSFIAADSWRDVPKAVREYGSLTLIEVQCHDWIEKRDINPDTLQFPYHLHFSPGKTLLNSLAEMLEFCRSQSIFRLEDLRLDRSETYPIGYLVIGVYVNTPAGDDRRWHYTLRFGPTDPKESTDVIEVSYRLMGPALNTMADLLAPNVAAANRARMQAKHETGPSALTDEPIPLDDDDPLQAAKPTTNSSDNLPRAARPATTDTHPEASDKEKKSQVGFKSCGRSSGGSSLPPTELYDDRNLNDRPDRPSPCAA